MMTKKKETTRSTPPPTLDDDRLATTSKALSLNAKLWQEPVLLFLYFYDCEIKLTNDVKEVAQIKFQRQDSTDRNPKHSVK